MILYTVYFLLLDQTPQVQNITQNGYICAVDLCFKEIMLKALCEYVFRCQPFRKVPEGKSSMLITYLDTIICRLLV